ncbi:MAG TPA: hypothetical protein VER37_06470 [Thermomicrobiales bacterium]|nr:hypothetical protein [Thermomicrobiales bacterium]
MATFRDVGLGHIRFFGTAIVGGIIDLALPATRRRAAIPGGGAMEPFVLDPTRLPPSIDLLGAVVTEDVRAAGRKLFSKGHRLTGADLAVLPTLDRPVHAVRLAPDDVHEDDAGHRLALAVAGHGLGRTVELRGPVQSRYNLAATTKGLLRVDAERLRAINLIEGMAVFTLPDGMVVLPGRTVTGVKITPVAVPEAALREAEAVAAGRPVAEVRPFLPRAVGVVSTEGMADRVRQRFRETVERKIGWFGGRVVRFEERPAEPVAVAAAIEGLIADGAEVVLAAGGNTIDPLDATLRALPAIGAEMVRFGAPAHPGSMFWLARRGAVPIVNLASCSMYSKATVADLVLPPIMAGEEVGPNEMADLGLGGLLDRGMGWRFPQYHESEDAAGDGNEEG